MYYSRARLNEDGSCTLYLHHDDDPGEEIGSIMSNGEIKANYINNELTGIAVLDGLRQMGLVEKYETVKKEIANAIDGVQIIVDEVLNCFHTNYRDSLVQRHFIKERSLEDCFGKVWILKHNTKNDNTRYYRFNDVNLEQKYNNWERKL